MCIKNVSMRTTVIVVILCIIIGFVFSIAPLLGWSRYTPEGALTTCGVEWNERSFNVISYTIAACVALYVFPLITIIFTSVQFFKIVSKFILKKK